MPPTPPPPLNLKKLRKLMYTEIDKLSETIQKDVDVDVDRERDREIN